MTAVESLSTSWEITDELKSQELQKDVLCETGKEAYTLGIISEGEKPKIKEFSISMTTDRSCAQTTTQLEEEDLYDIVKEGKYQDYIEIWFQDSTAISFLHSTPIDANKSKLVALLHSGKHYNNLFICG